MISDLMADSRRWEEQSRRHRGGSGTTDPFYPPDIVSGSEEPDPVPGRALFQRDQSGAGSSVRRESTRSHPSTEWVGRDAVRPDLQRRSYRTEQTIVHDTPSLHGRSSLSRSSTYESPSISSRDTQLPSPSTDSTAPSSVQSISDERRRLSYHGAAYYTPRRTSGSPYSGPIQGPRHPAQTHPDSNSHPADPRNRPYRNPRPSLHTDVADDRGVTMATMAAYQRPDPSSDMQPDDDPPDWDETPNFRGFARGL